MRERKAIIAGGRRLAAHRSACTRRSASPSGASCGKGYFADLVAFDPATIGTTPVERVHDQPGGADRLLVRSTGVEHMWVNGVATRSAGEDLPGVAAGRVLRS